MSRFRLALIVVSALLVAAVITARRRQVRRSPLYSLQRLADAARAKDRVGIEQYLDVTRVAESVVDAAGPSGEEVSRPLLVTLVEQSLWSALTDSLSRRYAGIAGVVQEARVARVGVRLRLPDGDSALVVHLRMEPADGHWRVVAVEDFAPYLQASLEPRLERAYELEMRSALRNLVNAEGMYFADHGTYTQSVGVLTYFNATPDVNLEISAATRDGWKAVARHQKTRAECRIAVGTAVAPGDAAGQPQCARPGER